MAWQEVLFRRLTARFEEWFTGPKTQDAEDALGFADRMVYYYVGRCVPSFGAYAIAGRRTGEETLTTPFDTGALVEGYISAPGFTQAIGALVERNTYAGDTFEAPMTDWLGEAFAAPSEYSAGLRPGFHTVSEIDLGACTGDERVWTWEARLPVGAYAHPPVQPYALFFSEGTRELYIDWVQQTTLLMVGERAQHSDDVYAYSEEVGDAAERMLALLKKEMTL